MWPLAQDILPGFAISIFGVGVVVDETLHITGVAYARLSLVTLVAASITIAIECFFGARALA